MGLWKDKKRKDWRYSFQFRGKTYAGGGHKTKADAKTAREYRRDQVKTGEKQSPATMGFREMASLYLDDAERRFAKKTYKYKAYVYRSFLEYFKADQKVQELTPQIIDNYLKTRSSNHNYNVHLKEISALFTYARLRLRIIQYNPCWDLEKLPHTPKTKRVPTENEILRLIAAAAPEDERPLVLILIHTAARIDEILRLKWNDVNFDKRLLTRWTRKRKGGSYEPITVAINKDLYEVLWNLWENRIQGDWVFYNEKAASRYKNRLKMLKSISKRAGIQPPILFHEIRHFIASYLADSKKTSTKTLSGILGHKTQKTTEIYLHQVEESQTTALKSLEGKFMLAGHACGFDEKESQKTASSSKETR